MVIKSLLTICQHLKWQPTPVFLPGESQGQRSLAGYSPWGGKESDTTKRLEGMLDWRESEFRLPRATLTTQKAKGPLCPDCLKRPFALEL